MLRFISKLGVVYFYGGMFIFKRRGVIIWILKNEFDFFELLNWCLIMLLNMDYKIVLKVMVLRIKKKFFFVLLCFD